MNLPSDSSPPGGLGAQWSDSSTRFTLRAPLASRVVLELSTRDGTRRLDLERSSEGSGLWRIDVPQLPLGTPYGYRVDGPWLPDEGLRFHRQKLLVDPCALAVTGEPRWGRHLVCQEPPDPQRTEDTGHLMPRGIVIDPTFDWKGEARRPPRPWSETVLYEAHVRGMTRLHPDVPPEIRGTYLGMASDPVMQHLVSLGVTAVELMPIQQFASERHLLERGMRNYWGYAPLALRAPHAGYATLGDGRQVRECQEMVRRFHAAGLEVILDIVLNHTAEGGLDGLRLGWQGIDPRGFYRWQEAELVDWTGCGNTIDPRSVVARAYLLEVLRGWVLDYHVDGFRLDLGPVLGRDPGRDFTPRDAWFFRALEEDPVLSSVKWIAEPWDLGPDGYCRGAFPVRVKEWDDRARDDLRRFWLFGESSQPFVGHLHREAGTEPHFIQFVTAHDGNTLLDLVSYDGKHNRANREHNRDGHDGEVRRNHGCEGPTEDPDVQLRRDLARRHLVLSLALGGGIPMLCHGDELGRTQRGNNNAYCQDSPLTWLDWNADREFLDFVRRAFALRQPLERTGSLRDLGGFLHEGEPRLAFALEIGDRLLLVNATEEEQVIASPLVRGRRLLLSSRTEISDPGTDLRGPEMRVLGPVG